MGGAAIGGGGSTKQKGGSANINISGGTIIAKSTEGTFYSEDISAGVSIGGGTGKTGGGTVKLTISEESGKKTILAHRLHRRVVKQPAQETSAAQK